MIRLSIFWSLGQTAAINKAYIETINFNALIYLTPSYIRVLTWKTMCGAQQLKCKSESAPQIIGAHQPQQACNEYTHIHCCESTVTTGWKRGHISWDSCASLSEPRSLGTGALFLISESGRGEGAQLLASRPDYMEFAEWKRGHIWDILATVQPWDWK